MNFCRVYNKIMNRISKLAQIYIEENPSLPERTNVNEINIFFGIIWVITSFMALIYFGGLCYIRTKGITIMRHIIKKTSSKCG